MKRDEWTGGGRRRRRDGVASRWFSRPHVPELKPVTALRVRVGHAQGHPGNQHHMLAFR